jgi:hypothetical protein
MMPDYGSFTIAWTAYGIVLPLVQHVFGIRPDAGRKMVVFEPHVPSGWEEMSIADVPVGTNLVSLTRTKTDRGTQYDIESRENGWTLELKGDAVAGSQHYLNDKPVAFAASGIRMTGQKNRVLVVPR